MNYFMDLIFDEFLIDLIFDELLIDIYNYKKIKDSFFNIKTPILTEYHSYLIIKINLVF